MANLLVDKYLNHISAAEARKEPDKKIICDIINDVKNSEEYDYNHFKQTVGTPRNFSCDPRDPRDPRGFLRYFYTKKKVEKQNLGKRKREIENQENLAESGELANTKYILVNINTYISLYNNICIKTIPTYAVYR